VVWPFPLVRVDLPERRNLVGHPGG
jgi:hypothetical protein